MPLGRVPDDYYAKVRPGVQRRIVRHLRSALNVVDLGCGNCELVKRLARGRGRRVLGVDRRDAVLAPHSPRLGYRCHRADATRLRFVPSGWADAVVSTSALHEMDRPLAVLREAYRILRPGGRALIVDFTRDSLAQRLWNEGYYRPGEVRELLRRAGFREARARRIARGQLLWATAVRGDGVDRLAACPTGTC